jgi:DNA-binding PadR family transcriptional regulator
VRFYRLTPKGKRQLTAESNRWEALARAVARVMRPETLS